jgi:hypothetical protein
MPMPTPAPGKVDPVGSDHDDEVSDESVKELYDTLDEQLKSLPPETQKELAKYGNLGKLAPKDRMKKLAELDVHMAERLDDVTSVAKVATGAWIERHALDAPPGWNPKHLDIAAFLPWAIAQAKQAIPDAELYRIDVDGVSPEGFADLTLATLASDNGSIDLRFTSKSHATRDPKIPLGARNEMNCEFRITAEPDGVAIAPMFATQCKEKPVPLPRCGYVALWKRALKKGAPQGAVANIGLRSDFNGRPTWYFNIGFGTDVSYSEMWNDDC